MKMVWTLSMQLQKTYALDLKASKCNIGSTQPIIHLKYRPISLITYINVVQNKVGCNEAERNDTEELYRNLKKTRRKKLNLLICYLQHFMNQKSYTKIKKLKFHRHAIFNTAWIRSCTKTTTNRNLLIFLFKIILTNFFI